MSNLPKPGEPTTPGNTLCARALSASLAHDDTTLTAILGALTPGELHTLADAATRLRRACEQVHNGGQGEPEHHGRRRWEFQA